MGHGQIVFSDRRSLGVSLAGTFRWFRFFRTIGELRDVPVVVGLHLLVEDLGLATRGLGDELREEVKDVITNFLELGFHLAAIFPGEWCIFRVSLAGLLLSNTSDDAPCGPAAPHCVL